MGEFNVNKSDGSLEQTAGMPSEYPATQVMLSDGVTSVENRLDKLALSTFGPYETITSYTVANPYVCQRDGYVRISIQQNGKGHITVNGLVIAGSESIVSYQIWAVFVRKGSKLAISANTNAVLTFFPIEEETP